MPDTPMTTAARRVDPFLVYISGFFIIIAAVTVLWALGLSAAAWLVGNLGTLAYVMLVLAWVTVRGSRSKWPGRPWWVRLGNVISFQRGD